MLLVAVGCSTEPEEVQYPNEYFPAKENDIFSFRTLVFNVNGDTIARRTDKVQYIKADSVNGREAVVGVVYSKPTAKPYGGPLDTIYYDIKTGAIEQFISPANVPGLPDVTFSPQWTRFGGFTSADSNWITFDTLLRDVPFIVGPRVYRGSGTITQRNQRSQREEQATVIELGDERGTPVLAQQFISTTVFDFKVLIENDSVPVNFTNVERYYFARDRGLVKQVRPAYNVIVGPNVVPVDGYETVLIGRGEF
jgi:hypothetical protein